ncbi:helix-turn-helix domain-containing protein [Ralstonia pickettii]|jgi:DNA binding domain, excisionase family|uniref:helix-turn-helix domain-containing protein n=1 Tax=Ralstonia pickettii TaxID=329 RepID=UPI0009C0A476|nr:helix-turn-helix domain-containing protein [Ralstonia pickettii]
MKARKAVLDSMTPIYVDPSASSDVSNLSPAGLTVGIKGAAEILHIHPNTVVDLITNGQIPAAKVGRAWVMMTRDVLAYVERLIIAQTAERLVATGRPQPTSVSRRRRRF